MMLSRLKTWISILISKEDGEEMIFFRNNEVKILKDSCDSKEYLSKLKDIRSNLESNSKNIEKIDKEIAIIEAGIFGEESILYELKNSGLDLIVLRDLYLKTEDGRTAQIDFFVITPYVNVIIECKNLFGNIEINNKGEFIRSFEYKGHKYKEGIYSPITQNERHLEIYKDCWKADKGLVAKIIAGKYFTDFNKTIVVLANPKTVVNDKFAKKEIKQQVIRCDQLINYLKTLKNDNRSSFKAMNEAGERILAMNINERNDYLNKFEELIQEEKNDNSTLVDSMVCPYCGGKMILRTAKKGKNIGNTFYGCSNFPKCRYIKNF